MAGVAGRGVAVADPLAGVVALVAAGCASGVAVPVPSPGSAFVGVVVAATSGASGVVVAGCVGEIASVASGVGVAVAAGAGVDVAPAATVAVAAGVGAAASVAPPRDSTILCTRAKTTTFLVIQPKSGMATAKVATAVGMSVGIAVTVAVAVVVFAAEVTAAPGVGVAAPGAAVPASGAVAASVLSLIHISEPTRPY